MFKDKSSPRAFPLLIVATLFVTAMAYWPGLGGGFTFDDYQNIVENPALRVSQLDWQDWLAAAFSSPASALQRPLAMVSFAANHFFTGLDPWPMKLTNLVIHLLNTLLVFGLVRSVFGAVVAGQDPSHARQPERVALFTATIWALNPINLMAVLFIVQRMEGLSHTFVFLGLWLYVLGRIRQQDGRSGWGLILIGLVPCPALGLLAKESAVLLPLYAFCLELFIFRFRGADAQRDRRIALLFTVLLLLPALIALAWLLPHAMRPGAFSSRTFTLAERLMTEPRVVMDYFRWTLLPDLRQLSLYHDDYVVSRGLFNPVSTAIAILAITTMVGLTWIGRLRRPLIGLGLSWFLAAQLLTATFINLELVFEHRNYFASLGLCVALADLLLLAPAQQSTRRLGVVIAGIFLTFSAATTHLRAREWSDPFRFASTEVAKQPNSPRATYGLARILVGATKYDPNSPITDAAWTALDRARAVQNSGILPDQAALIFAARTGRALQAEWWQDMQYKLRQRPIGPQEQISLVALSNCAVEGICQFPEQDMLATFGAALVQGPNPGVLSTFGKYSLHVLHDPSLALRLWRSACAGDPENPQFRLNLAMLLIDLGRDAEAANEIARLKRTGRLGQHAKTAARLDAYLRTNGDRASLLGIP